MPLFSFIRLRKRPPEKKPPPKNFVDMFWDPDTSALSFQASDGTISKIDTGLTSAEVQALIDGQTSTGGNATADSGKLVTFGANGGQITLDNKTGTDGQFALSCDANLATATLCWKSSGLLHGIYASAFTGSNVFSFYATGAAETFAMKGDGTFSIGSTIAANLTSEIGATAMRSGVGMASYQDQLAGTVGVQIDDTNVTLTSKAFVQPTSDGTGSKGNIKAVVSSGVGFVIYSDQATDNRNIDILIVY